jgi:tetratricopeptide (TPR) repeat protein
MFEISINKFGQINGYVHYAGITPISGIQDCDEETYDNVFDINLKSAFFENEKNLQTVALYSLDRKHLSKKFDLLQSFSENNKTEPAIPVKTPPLQPYSQLQQDEEVLLPASKDLFSSWNESVGTPFANKNIPINKKSLPEHLPVSINQFRHSAQEASVQAERSIQENSMPVSETYAKILVQQNQIDKAIEVYERLILIFPKKSALFVSEIENLKNI